MAARKKKKKRAASVRVSRRMVATQQLRTTALDLRLQGLGYRQIAQQMGMAVGWVHELVAVAIADIPREQADQVRRIESEKLDMREQSVRYICHAAMQTIAKALDAAACANKAKADGDPKADSLALQAGLLADAALEASRVALDADRTIGKISERRAKLLGLDAPVVTELTGPNGTPLGSNITPAEAARLVREQFGAQTASKKPDVPDAEIVDENAADPAQLESNVVELRPDTSGPVPRTVPEDAPEA